MRKTILITTIKFFYHCIWKEWLKSKFYLIISHIFYSLSEKRQPRFRLFLNAIFSNSEFQVSRTKTSRLGNLQKRKKGNKKKGILAVFFFLFTNSTNSIILLSNNLLLSSTLNGYCNITQFDIDLQPSDEIAIIRSPFYLHSISLAIKKC